MRVDNDGNILELTVGDRVQVRSYEDMFNRYGANEDGSINCVREVFTTQMIDFQGLKAKVVEVKRNSKGKPTGIVKLEGEIFDYWNKFKFALEMLEEEKEDIENENK